MDNELVDSVHAVHNGEIIDNATIGRVPSISATFTVRIWDPYQTILMDLSDLSVCFQHYRTIHGILSAGTLEILSAKQEVTAKWSLHVEG